MAEDRHGSYPNRPNDRSMIQHHQCRFLDCRQLPLNNKYTDDLIINSKVTATIYTPMPHTEIHSHMNIIFHQDPKTQRIKNSAYREISGQIGFHRRNA